ncbi:MAG: 23S rRNA (adenine(2503)-C(2))-methyltransferase RlmN [Lachnospiraceae bacterium]|nr:23S rRNA (adenine(2503)-C(2))-methyltransferase RlmN [Lachnospiraceae bacterium]
MDIKSMSLQELEIIIKEKGEKAFRAKQIYQWIHQKQVSSYEEMSNIPLKLREILEEEYPLMKLNMIQVQESSLDGTRKYLFGLEDGNMVESVWMKYHHGNSVCISSQVGCRMGCRFCASTLDGLERNLKPSEMLEQIYSIIRHTGERVSNLVIMGTGEPMDNYENVVKFLRLLTGEEGYNMSQRNITVSTCGIVEGIRKLAEEKLQITLALSLHATTDEKRRQLMPVAYRYELKEVLKACEYYFEKTGRRVSFEYSLVAGVNDNLNDAKELADLVKGMNCHVNLIPVNPIKERDYRQSEKKQIEDFKNYLNNKGVTATVRREMGRDIDGACGQLRRRHMKNQ